MRDLVQQGASLIFATSFGYLEPALRVAADFPDVKFEHAGGYRTAPNLATYDARYYEARWLAGWLAGTVSRSGIAGYVAGVSGARGRAGHQRLHARHARREPARAPCACSGSTPGSIRRASATRPSRSSTRVPTSSPTTAARRRWRRPRRQRGRIGGVRVDAVPERHARVRARCAALRHRAPLGRLLQPALPRASSPARGRTRRSGAASPPAWSTSARSTRSCRPRVRDGVRARRQAIVAGSLAPFAAPLVDNTGRVRLARGALDDARDQGHGLVRRGRGRQRAGAPLKPARRRAAGATPG